MIYLSIGSFGIIGALLRYYLGISIHEWWVYSFPLGTLLINYIGAFTLGWFTYNVAHLKIPEWFRIGFATGLIGSFTTFSTFSVETVNLLDKGLIIYALGYVALSLFGGLMFPFLGYRMSKVITREGE